MELMRKKPATNGAGSRHCGGVRGAAFSAAQSTDIKSASRWNTSAFGEQPSRPQRLFLPWFPVLFWLAAFIDQFL